MTSLLDYYTGETVTQLLDGTNASGHRAPGNIILSIGVLLLGLAALVVAFQWETHTRISVDTPPVAGPPKSGFTLFHNREVKEYSADKHEYLLLDRDSGRIWAKDPYSSSWKEVKVEGITPRTSPAASR